MGAFPATPTGFVQSGNAQQQSNGVLGFVYTWGSTTNSLQDLANCQVRELVTYPDGNPYYWKSPPYATGTYTINPNTGDTPGPATAGRATDSNGHVPFRSPYAPGDDITLHQVFQFECSNYRGGAWNNMTLDIPIRMTVDQDTNGTWKYTITKSGASNSVNPLP